VRQGVIEALPIDAPKLIIKNKIYQAESDWLYIMEHVASLNRVGGRPMDDDEKGRAPPAPRGKLSIMGQGGAIC